MKGFRAILPEPGKVVLEAFEVPEPDHNEVVIRTTKTLISPGTERALLLNLPGLNVKYPKAVGYSHVGVIIEVGQNVRQFNVGDRVASKSRHASHVIANADVCHKLSDDLMDEPATFFQLLTTSLQAVRKTRLEVGESAAIVGVGLIGLFAVQVARVMGALPIFAIDVHESRLAIAKKIGADHIFTSDTSIEGLTKLGGFPVVIEATGNPMVLDTACQITAIGGRISLLGSSRGKADAFDFYTNVHKKGITLIGAHIHTGNRLASAPGWWTLYDEQQTALKLLQHKRVIVEPLITHRFTSEQIADAYALLADWNMDAMGMIVDWNTYKS